MRLHVASLAVLGGLTLPACGRTISPVELAVTPVASASTSGAQVAARTVVRTARLIIEVQELADAREQALALSRGFEATVEREMQEGKEVTLRLRIPESRLDSVLDTLETLGRVNQRSSASEDQSAFAADLDARIQNLIASRDRLRSLYDRAAAVTDVVALERELSRVQGELDSLESQLTVLRRRAAQSTADVVLRQQIVLGPLGLIAQGGVKLISRLFVWR